MLCVACKKKLKDNATSDKFSPIPSLSPITTQCDPVKEMFIHEAISVLIEGVHTKKIQLKEYKIYLERKLTHLNPKLHNIFSLNSINSKPVEGLFLSSPSVMTRLRPEKDYRVTEEFLNFFVNFNFYGEFIPAIRQHSKELPNIVFYKTKDEIDKINVLYKKSDKFSLVNNAISAHFTEDDEKQIINETKI